MEDRDFPPACPSFVARWLNQKRHRQLGADLGRSGKAQRCSKRSAISGMASSGVRRRLPLTILVRHPADYDHRCLGEVSWRTKHRISTTTSGIPMIAGATFLATTLFLEAVDRLTRRESCLGGRETSVASRKM